MRDREKGVMRDYLREGSDERQRERSDERLPERRE